MSAALLRRGGQSIMAALRDLTYPAHPALRGAQASGFAARLAGDSRFANVYGDAIERREADGRRPGWLWALWHAWDRGWQNADSLCGGDAA